MVKQGVIGSGVRPARQASCNTIAETVVRGRPGRLVPLTVRLDQETEHCLDDLLVETGQDKSSLIRQLIRERWQQRQALPSITDRLGGHPVAFLDTLAPGGAERTCRRQALSQWLEERRAERR